MESKHGAAVQADKNKIPPVTGASKYGWSASIEIRCSEEANIVHILWTVIIGLIVGAIAKFLMPGRDPGGLLITMLLGIAGSFVATFLGRVLGLYEEGGSAGFIMSVLGAMLLLFIYHLVRKRAVV